MSIKFVKVTTIAVAAAVSLGVLANDDRNDDSYFGLMRDQLLRSHAMQLFGINGTWRYFGSYWLALNVIKCMNVSAAVYPRR